LGYDLEILIKFRTNDIQEIVQLNLRFIVLTIKPKVTGTDEEIKAHFRKVRNEIKEYTKKLFWKTYRPVYYK